MKNEKFCFKNEELCSKNKEFCISNNVFCSNNTGYLLYGMGIRSFTLPWTLVQNGA